RVRTDVERVGRGALRAGRRQALRSQGRRPQSSALLGPPHVTGRGASAHARRAEGRSLRVEAPFECGVSALADFWAFLPSAFAALTGFAAFCAFGAFCAGSFTPSRSEASCA